MTAVVVAASLVGLAAWLRGLPARRPEAVPRNAESPRLASRLSPAARWHRRRDLAAASAQLGELLSALVAELSAGQPADSALRNALQPLHPALCPRTRAAVDLRADVAGALRQDSVHSGMGELTSLAACWEVAAHSGAGLAGAVGRLAETGRATRRARDQLRAEVAAVQSTARILAGLPLFGLVVGQWLGADPVAWLIGTWAGRVTLLCGMALEAVGLLWLSRIVRAARAAL